jgi:transposase-like protein
METKETEFIFTERANVRQCFDKRLIRHIVDLAAQGVPRRDLIDRYGMSGGSLKKWIANGGPGPDRRSYSMAEKRAVLRAFQGGMGIKEIQIAYGISSPSLVQSWIRRFNEENTELCSSKGSEMGNKTTDQHDSPEVRALKKALEEANLKVRALDTLIDIAEQQLKIDIRKKSGAKRSSK